MHGTKWHHNMIDGKSQNSQILICWDTCIIKTKRDFKLVSSQKVLELTISSYPKCPENTIPFPQSPLGHTYNRHMSWVVTPRLWVWSKLSRVGKHVQMCVCDLVTTHGTKWRKISKLSNFDMLIYIIKTKTDFQLVSSQKVLEFTILS
jgi:hypothetical protein